MVLLMIFSSQHCSAGACRGEILEFFGDKSSSCEEIDYVDMTTANYKLRGVRGHSIKR